MRSLRRNIGYPGAMQSIDTNSCAALVVPQSLKARAVVDACGWQVHARIHVSPPLLPTLDIIKKGSHSSINSAPSVPCSRISYSYILIARRMSRTSTEEGYFYGRRRKADQTGRWARAKYDNTVSIRTTIILRVVRMTRQYLTACNMRDDERLPI